MIQDPKNRLGIVVVGITIVLLLTVLIREARQTFGATGPEATDEPSQVINAKVSFALKTPLGLPALPIPIDNPLTQAKIELGRQLYFDKRLSADGTISCATCHDPKTGWTERRSTSRGIDGQVGGRNAPTIINAAYHRSQFWDGRMRTLEEQALGPIANPIEMGRDIDELVDELAKIPEYDRAFHAVFGTDPTREGLGQAIAAFERTILSGDSPYDRFVAGDEDALTPAQRRGWDIFMNEADCAMCHTPPTFSSGRFYNAGVGSNCPDPDPGRMEVTGKARDMGRFRVPSLREVANTAPYFHDGSAETLEDAVAIMAGGGIDNPNLSSMFRVLRDLQLTDQDCADLVEFLKALSGEYPIIDPPAAMDLQRRGEN